MMVFSIEDELTGYREDVYCIMEKGKRWVLKTLLSSCGIDRNSDGNYNWSVDNLIGKKVLGLVVHEPNEFINRAGETVKGTQHRIIDFKKYEAPEPSGKEQIGGKDVAWDE